MTTLVAAHTATKLTQVVNGRSYTTSYGGTVAVPDADAPQLEANGWLNFGMAGTTAQRPVGPAKGQRYIDTTLSIEVMYDGVSAWRNVVTGAVS